MIHLDVRLNLDKDPWIDLEGEDVHKGELERIGLVPTGTSEGKPVVPMLVRDDTGRVIIVQTTYRLFRACARMFAATPAGIATEEEW